MTVQYWLVPETRITPFTLGEECIRLYTSAADELLTIAHGAFVHHFDDHVLGETLVRWWSQGFRTGLLMEPEGKRVSEHKCN
jgi:hypothetical protein